MMRGSNAGRLSLGVLLSGLALVAGLAGFAVANSSKHRITPVTRSTAGATLLGRVIMADKKQLIDAKFVTVPPDGTPNAISNKRILVNSKKLGAFPLEGSYYAIMTNGCATLADHQKDAGLPGCRDNGLQIRGARDVTILRLHVKVPKGANCLSFRFRFLSQEFPDFVGQQFNDAFIAELDHSTWDASNGSQIVAPRDFARDVNGHVVQINKTGLDRMSALNSQGTTYGGGTRILRASTPVNPGRHFVYLSIFDQGDRQYDSAAFVDNLTMSKRSPCKSGLS